MRISAHNIAVVVVNASENGVYLCFFLVRFYKLCNGNGFLLFFVYRRYGFLLV